MIAGRVTFHNFRRVTHSRASPRTSELLRSAMTNVGGAIRWYQGCAPVSPTNTRGNPENARDRSENARDFSSIWVRRSLMKTPGGKGKTKGREPLVQGLEVPGNPPKADAP